MKRLLTWISALTFSLAFTACGSSAPQETTTTVPTTSAQTSDESISSEQTSDSTEQTSSVQTSSDITDITESTERVSVKIGITGESENVIWASVIEKVALEGIDIEIINFADYTLLNGSLADGDIDLNAFQHHGFLNSEIADKGYDIIAIADTYISAMCIYSDKLTDIDGLKDGDKVAIPNDSINLGRALSVAQGAGLITLNELTGEAYGVEDIASNPLNLEFIQVDASQIPALLPDVAIGIINANYALDFGLSPIEDAIFYDDVTFYPDNRYVNNIVARTGEATNPVYLKIVAAYQSEEVEQIYKNEFKGSYLPAWKAFKAS